MKDKIKAFFVRFGKKFKDNWLKVICLLAALFVCGCAWFSSCSRTRKESTLQASADVVLEDYYVNLFPKVQDMYDFSTFGTLFTFNEDGSILLNGTVESAIFVNIGRLDLPYGLYCFSISPPFSFVSPAGTSKFMTISESNPYVTIYINVVSGTYDNVLIYPMVQRVSSQVTPDWIPPLYVFQEVYDQVGYDRGYQVGYDEGYEKGYELGVGVYQYGVFFDSTVKATVTTSSTSFNFSLPFNYELGTFTNVYQYLRDNYSEQLSTITNIDLSILPAVDSISPNNIDLKLVTSFFDNYTDFNYQYNDITMTAVFLNFHENAVPIVFQESINNRRTFVWSSGEVHKDFYNDSFNYSRSYFVSVDFSISNYEYLQGIELFSSYNAYNQAYDNGFNEGYESGYKVSQDTFQNQLQTQYDTGYKVGQEKGFNEGYTKGHTIGYNEGRDVTEQGFTFVSLIDAVGYGVTKPFVSLLNFDLLGVNLLSFATGILTLVLMIKLVGIFI